MNRLFDPMDRQDVPPADHCKKCGGEVYPGETMYFYEGRWMCLDCFKTHIESVLDRDPRALALALGLDMQKYI